jgi:KUP system potassium uptake protein
MSSVRSPVGDDDAPRSLRQSRTATGSEVDHHNHHHHAKGPGLVLAALGIVFGDIGTSPLYALKECIDGPHGVAATHANVLGVLSLIVWSLTLVVTVKYLGFVMRADNGGEGGILALLALVTGRARERAATPQKLRAGDHGMGWIAILVLAGAALLYGDGMITPAISVLSATEGLEAEAHALKPWIVPITCLILVGLFAIQSRGTEGIGRFFGPIMFVWFVTIGGLGVWHLFHNPAVLSAVDPRHAISFFQEHKLHGFGVLGAVVLAVTGGEALYADMGHFGRQPIRVAWLALVFPALLLAYFGMGALVLADPAAAKNPFFGMVPRGLPTYALVGLATCATIIASQALISGAFSLTHQAVQLGYFPRVLIRHTSKDTMGQIYVPVINWLLAVMCVVLVLAFGESSRLAAAYGIAVTGTMAITSIVFFVVMRDTWGWSLAKSVPLLLFFLSFDLAFLGANTLKFLDGGWVPVLIGTVFFAMMVVWKRGRRFLADLYATRTRPIDELLAALEGKGGVPGKKPLTLQGRTTGTGVFMAAMKGGVPPILLHHVERVRVLPEKVVLLTVVTAHTPFVPDGKRTELEKLPQGFYRVVGRYGFMEKPNVPQLLREAKGLGLDIDLSDVTYFLGRETILGLPGGRMGALEETFFAILSRNARHAGQYFELPPEQVVEIGVQVDL